MEVLRFYDHEKVVLETLAMHLITLFCFLDELSSLKKADLIR